MSHTPLSSRAEQLSAQINTAQDTAFTRLQEHSDWQSQHIAVIEEQKQQLEQHIHELTSQNAHFHNEIANLQHQLSQQQPHNLISGSHQLEEKMLQQIQENTHFLHHLIHNQDKVIKNRNAKINTLQRSFSWQITGPLRAVKTVTSGVSNTASNIFSQATKTALEAHSYINERPKLKNNLMQMTGLNKLYKNK